MLNYILFILGIIIILTSFYFIKAESSNLNNSQESHQIFQEVVSSINTIEKIIDEMNTTYYEIVKDLEKKYLFIYEKYKLYNQELEITNKGEQENKRDLSNEKDKILLNKDKILALKEKGYSISQIAKELNKGKEEIQLFLNIRQK